MTPSRAALLLCAAAILTAAAHAPAPASGAASVDSYFGHPVTDPYRWMETPSPALASWTAAQTARTRAALAAIPGREALARHMADIASGMAVVSAVTPVGQLVFFRRRDAYQRLGQRPGAPPASLMVRDTQTGHEHVLLDPNKITLDGAPVSIDQFAPSQDGRYVAVGIGRIGAPQDVLYVLDADTGRRLPDQIDRTRFASVSWLPDGRSFFYNRLRRADPGQGQGQGQSQSQSQQDRFTYQKVFLHRLGQDPSRDIPVFGAGLPGMQTVAPADFVAVAAIIGTRSVLALQNDGASADLSLYLGQLQQGDGGYAWQRITRPQDGVVDVAAGRDTLYLRSRLGAPRYKVLALPLAHPVLAEARLAVAPSDAVLTNMAVSAGALYVAGRSGAVSTLVRVGADGHAVALHLPRQGSIAPPREGPGSLTADPRVPGAIVGVASWVDPPAYYALDDQGTDVHALGLAPTPARSPYVITETTVRANDGRTRLPLSIIEAPGTRHDDRRPVLVLGYGAYGISEEPSPALIPTIRAWIDAGGVMAIAHGRGGGELGEDWHAAGARDSKQASIHDFIDCAWAMTDLHYASPDTLAATGTGAGGVAVGGAIVQMASLFRAAYVRNGLFDPLRHEVSPGAAGRVPEFGTVSLQADVNALLAADPYQHVLPKISYPAVLLSAGDADPDVPFWHSAKMAARLQAAARSRGPVLLTQDDDAIAAQADGLAFLLWQLGVQGFQPQGK